MTCAIEAGFQKILSETPGYDTLSLGVTNLLHKSSLKMTWLITPVNHKLLSETPGYDTLSVGEGRGEASDWQI